MRKKFQFIEQKKGISKTQGLIYKIFLTTAGIDETALNDYMGKKQCIHYELVKKMLEREREANDKLLAEINSKKLAERSTQTSNFSFERLSIMITDYDKPNEKYQDCICARQSSSFNRSDIAEQEFSSMPVSLDLSDSSSDYSVSSQSQFSSRNSIIFPDLPIKTLCDENLSTSINSPDLKTPAKPRTKVPPLRIDKIPQYNPFDNPVSFESGMSSLSFSKNSWLLSSFNFSENSSGLFNLSSSPRTPKADVGCHINPELLAYYGIKSNPGDDGVSAPTSMSSSRFLHSREWSNCSGIDEENIAVYIPRIVPVAFSVISNQFPK
ncbi:unnamed protein product [Blepharisma stoltei]|uniref:Uncharacterized protein n=1 Tax=Blepharisma stoltei TaxID=1481888 RepID=A0AAU9JS41_9CILI|nr:unnamed protein product [Blepharisma stoltei]